MERDAAKHRRLALPQGVDGEDALVLTRDDAGFQPAY
jgi:hypothetical protein